MIYKLNENGRIKKCVNVWRIDSKTNGEMDYGVDDKTNEGMDEGVDDKTHELTGERVDE